MDLYEAFENTTAAEKERLKRVMYITFYALITGITLSIAFPFGTLLFAFPSYLSIIPSTTSDVFSLLIINLLINKYARTIVVGNERKSSIALIILSYLLSSIPLTYLTIHYTKYAYYYSHHALTLLGILTIVSINTILYVYIYNKSFPRLHKLPSYILIGLSVVSFIFFYAYETPKSATSSEGLAFAYFNVIFSIVLFAAGYMMLLYASSLIRKNVANLIIISAMILTAFSIMYLAVILFYDSILYIIY
ncbi:MAG: hypothetical protein JHC31_15610 [Sulfurihydrogenibium sp.]|nr:hypothetical protein [Sulfurihydrogenibium sp.]